MLKTSIHIVIILGTESGCLTLYPTFEQVETMFRTLLYHLHLGLQFQVEESN